MSRRGRNAANGWQQPRYRHVPVYVASAGDEAIEVYGIAGGALDPWQEDVLRAAMGERPDGRWAAFEIGLNVARQNGKDEILLARELWGLFVGEEGLLIHSAHKFDTAMEHLERLVSLIDNVPEFSRRTKKVNRSHGQEGITLRNGARIRFRARTRSGGGRGYAKGKCVVFNEAMELPDDIVGSILPVMSAASMEAPGPQVWLAGSAVDQETMSNGLAFARLREAGIAGENARLAYFEWSAWIDAWLEAHGLAYDPNRAEVEQITPELLADVEAWAQANPALGRRISEEHVQTEHDSPVMSSRQFAVERLGLGDPPATTDEAARVIPLDVWQAAACRDKSQRIRRHRSFSVDVNPDRTWATISWAGLRGDEKWQIAVVDRQRGTGWVVDRCGSLDEEHTGCPFVVEAKGPAGNLIDDLRDAGINVVEADAADYVTACSDFYDGVVGDEIRYPSPQPELDAALADARRSSSDAWKWSRSGSASADISPLVSCTLAYWAARHIRAAAPLDLSAYRITTI